MNEEMNQVLEIQELDQQGLKEMKHHYKRLKKDHRRQNRKKAWPLRIVITLLILAIGFTGFTLYQKSERDKAMVQEDLQVIPVTLTQVTNMDLEQLYKGNGDIIAASTVDVYPDTTMGKVTRITADLGDYVRKGQTILWIDPSRPGQTYAESPVIAPISGTITNMNASVGSLATAQMPVATVGDLNHLQLETQIPEKYVSSVSLDQNIHISLISWEDGRSVEGRIVEISPVVNPTSRTMKVTMDILSNDPEIKAGMFARISMVIEQFESVPVLPNRAIVERFDDQFVYVVQGDTAVRRTVSSTLSLGGYSRIDEGLSGDEQVVLLGNNLLEDGSTIKVLEEE